MALIELFFIAAAYLVGSIPTGVIVGRFFSEKDIRKSGSGNIGATNAGRVLGIKFGIITFLGDVLKGFIPVFTAALFLDEVLFLSLTGFSAFAGHLFPVYLRFRGGKGVATALGVFIFLSPYPAFISIIFFSVTVALWRFVSLGSIIGVFVLPISAYLLSCPLEITVTASAVTALVIIKHIANIKRLLDGTENRIGRRSNNQL